MAINACEAQDFSSEDEDASDSVVGAETTKGHERKEEEKVNEVDVEKKVNSDEEMSPLPLDDGVDNVLSSTAGQDNQEVIGCDNKESGSDIVNTAPEGVSDMNSKPKSRKSVKKVTFNLPDPIVISEHDDSDDSRIENQLIGQCVTPQKQTKSKMKLSQLTQDPTKSTVEQYLIPDHRTPGGDDEEDDVGDITSQQKPKEDDEEDDDIGDAKPNRDVIVIDSDDERDGAKVDQDDEVDEHEEDDDGQNDDKANGDKVNHNDDDVDQDGDTVEGDKMDCDTVDQDHDDVDPNGVAVDDHKAEVDKVEGDKMDQDEDDADQDGDAVDDDKVEDDKVEGDKVDQDEDDVNQDGEEDNEDDDLLKRNDALRFVASSESSESSSEQSSEFVEETTTGNLHDQNQNQNDMEIQETPRCSEPKTVDARKPRPTDTAPSKPANVTGLNQDQEPGRNEKDEDLDDEQEVEEVDEEALSSKEQKVGQSDSNSSVSAIEVATKAPKNPSSAPLSTISDSNSSPSGSQVKDQSPDAPQSESHRQVPESNSKPCETGEVDPLPSTPRLQSHSTVSDLNPLSSDIDIDVPISPSSKEEKEVTDDVPSPETVNINYDQESEDENQRDSVSDSTLKLQRSASVDLTTELELSGMGQNDEKTQERGLRKPTSFSTPSLRRRHSTSGSETSSGSSHIQSPAKSEDGHLDMSENSTSTRVSPRKTSRAQRRKRNDALNSLLDVCLSPHSGGDGVKYSIIAEIQQSPLAPRHSANRRSKTVVLSQLSEPYKKLVRLVLESKAIPKQSQFAESYGRTMVNAKCWLQNDGGPSAIQDYPNVADVTTNKYLSTMLDYAFAYIYEMQTMKTCFDKYSVFSALTLNADILLSGIYEILGGWKSLVMWLKMNNLQNLGLGLLMVLVNAVHILFPTKRTDQIPERYSCLLRELRCNHFIVPDDRVNDEAMYSKKSQLRQCVKVIWDFTRGSVKYKYQRCMIIARQSYSGKKRLSSGSSGSDFPDNISVVSMTDSLKVICKRFSTLRVEHEDKKLISYIHNYRRSFIPIAEFFCWLNTRTHAEPLNFTDSIGAAEADSLVAKTLLFVCSNPHSDDPYSESNFFIDSLLEHKANKWITWILDAANSSQLTKSMAVLLLQYLVYSLIPEFMKYHSAPRKVTFISFQLSQLLFIPEVATTINANRLSDLTKYFRFVDVANMVKYHSLEKLFCGVPFLGASLWKWAATSWATIKMLIRFSFLPFHKHIHILSVPNPEDVVETVQVMIGRGLTHIYLYIFGRQLLRDKSWLKVDGNTTNLNVNDQAVIIQVMTNEVLLFRKNELSSCSLPPPQKRYRFDVEKSESLPNGVEEDMRLLRLSAGAPKMIIVRDNSSDCRCVMIMASNGSLKTVTATPRIMGHYDAALRSMGYGLPPAKGDMLNPKPFLYPSGEQNPKPIEHSTMAQNPKQDQIGSEVPLFDDDDHSVAATSMSGCSSISFPSTFGNTNSPFFNLQPAINNVMDSLNDSAMDNNFDTTPEKDQDRDHLDLSSLYTNSNKKKNKKKKKKKENKKNTTDKSMFQIESTNKKRKKSYDDHEQDQVAVEHNDNRPPSHSAQNDGNEQGQEDMDMDLEYAQKDPNDLDMGKPEERSMMVSNWKFLRLAKQRELRKGTRPMRLKVPVNLMFDDDNPETRITMRKRNVQSAPDAVYAPVPAIASLLDWADTLEETHQVAVAFGLPSIAGQIQNQYGNHIPASVNHPEQWYLMSWALTQKLNDSEIRAIVRYRNIIYANWRDSGGSATKWNKLMVQLFAMSEITNLLGVKVDGLAEINQRGYELHYDGVKHRVHTAMPTASCVTSRHGKLEGNYGCALDGCKMSSWWSNIDVVQNCLSAITGQPIAYIPNPDHPRFDELKPPYPGCSECWKLTKPHSSSNLVSVVLEDKPQRMHNQLITSCGNPKALIKNSKSHLPINYPTHRNEVDIVLSTKTEDDKNMLGRSESTPNKKKKTRTISTASLTIWGNIMRKFWLFHRIVDPNKVTIEMVADLMEIDIKSDFSEFTFHKGTLMGHLKKSEKKMWKRPIHESRGGDRMTVLKEDEHKKWENCILDWIRKVVVDPETRQIFFAPLDLDSAPPKIFEGMRRLPIANEPTDSKSYNRMDHVLNSSLFDYVGYPEMVKQIVQLLSTRDHPLNVQDYMSICPDAIDEADYSKNQNVKGHDAANRKAKSMTAMQTAVREASSVSYKHKNCIKSGNAVYNACFQKSPSILFNKLKGILSPLQSETECDEAICLCLGYDGDDPDYSLDWDHFHDLKKDENLEQKMDRSEMDVVVSCFERTIKFGNDSDQIDVTTLSDSAFIYHLGFFMVSVVAGQPLKACGLCIVVDPIRPQSQSCILIHLNRTLRKINPGLYGFLWANGIYELMHAQRHIKPTERHMSIISALKGRDLRFANTQQSQVVVEESILFRTQTKIQFPLFKVIYAQRLFQMAHHCVFEARLSEKPSDVHCLRSENVGSCYGFTVFGSMTGHDGGPSFCDFWENFKENKDQRKRAVVQKNISLYAEWAKPLCWAKSTAFIGTFKGIVEFKPKTIMNSVGSGKSKLVWHCPPKMPGLSISSTDIIVRSLPYYRSFLKKSWEISNESGFVAAMGMDDEMSARNISKMRLFKCFTRMSFPKEAAMWRKLYEEAKQDAASLRSRSDSDSPSDAVPFWKRSVREMWIRSMVIGIHPLAQIALFYISSARRYKFTNMKSVLKSLFGIHRIEIFYWGIPFIKFSQFNYEPDLVDLSQVGRLTETLLFRYLHDVLHQKQRVAVTEDELKKMETLLKNRFNFALLEVPYHNFGESESDLTGASSSESGGGQSSDSSLEELSDLESFDSQEPSSSGESSSVPSEERFDPKGRDRNQSGYRVCPNYKRRTSPRLMQKRKDARKQKKALRKKEKLNDRDSKMKRPKVDSKRAKQKRQQKPEKKRKLSDSHEHGKSRKKQKVSSDSDQGGAHLESPPLLVIRNASSLPKHSRTGIPLGGFIDGLKVSGIFGWKRDNEFTERFLKAIENMNRAFTIWAIEAPEISVEWKQDQSDSVIYRWADGYGSHMSPSELVKRDPTHHEVRLKMWLNRLVQMLWLPIMDMFCNRLPVLDYILASRNWPEGEEYVKFEEAVRRIEKKGPDIWKGKEDRATFFKLYRDQKDQVMAQVVPDSTSGCKEDKHSKKDDDNGRGGAGKGTGGTGGLGASGNVQCGSGGAENGKTESGGSGSGKGGSGGSGNGQRGSGGATKGQSGSWKDPLGISDVVARKCFHLNDKLEQFIELYRMSLDAYSKNHDKPKTRAQIVDSHAMELLELMQEYKDVSPFHFSEWLAHHDIANAVLMASNGALLGENFNLWESFR